MMSKHSSSKRPLQFTGLVVSLLLFTSASTWAAKAETRHQELGNDEETFVFSGKCVNHESYRLVSYQRSVFGFTQSFYDYEGPNGKGTVQTQAPPRVMAARVCRRFAEIINANYWE